MNEVEIAKLHAASTLLVMANGRTIEGAQGKAVEAAAQYLAAALTAK